MVKTTTNVIHHLRPRLSPSILTGWTPFAVCRILPIHLSIPARTHDFFTDVRRTLLCIIPTRLSSYVLYAPPRVWTLDPGRRTRELGKELHRAGTHPKQPRCRRQHPGNEGRQDLHARRCPRRPRCTVREWPDGHGLQRQREEGGHPLRRCYWLAPDLYALSFSDTYIQAELYISAPLRYRPRCTVEGSRDHAHR